MTAQVAADLRAAAEVLRRDGWTQELLHRGTPSKTVCHCGDGAIAVATEAHLDVTFSSWAPFGYKRDKGGDFSRWHAARAAVDQYLGGSLVGFNDEPGRTADEVIATLEAAADAAEAPDCTHITSCEIGDHTYSWPCDYAPGSGKFAADVAEQQTTGVGGERSGLPGDVEPPADRDRHHGQD